VLGLVGSAMRVAARVIEQHPGDPAAADASVAGAWQPVATEYARLLAGIGG